MRINLGLCFLVVCAVFVTTTVAEARGGGGYRSGSKGYGYTNPRSSYVRPSVTRTGQVRSGHFRTAPNNTDKDNFGTSGNANPFTGKNGTKNSQSPF